MSGTPVNLALWAQRHGISAAALADLAALVVPPPPADAVPVASDSEAYAQSLVRLEAAQRGAYLFRNNVGVLQDENGRPVRYGLANDSKALNERLKSSDLIGFRRLTITPDMVGRDVAQFMSREVKARGWTWTGSPREQAQANWINLVLANGGDACFATGEGTIR